MIALILLIVLGYNQHMGNTLANGLTITQETTTPSRPGKKPRPVWVVGGRTDGLEQSLIDLGGRKWRGAFSFFDDPTASLEALTDDDRMSFAERQEREKERAAERADRYSGYAASAAGRAEAAYSRASAIAEMIPFGQPILVGHHSEARHRRDADRIDAGMRKSVEEDGKAQHWQNRAQTAAHKAEGAHSAAFCDRRVKECESWLRKIGSAIEGGAAGERRGRLLAAKSEQEDKKAYWEGEREAAGGIAYSKENVCPGDIVLVHSTWRRVVRSNAKTVSIETDYSWTDTCSYAKIRGHKAKAEIEAVTADAQAAP